jgi:hypothetical protein
MSNNSKQLSNPSSTGGLGTHFENRVQTSFVVLMLTSGFAPCLPTWPINKIKLQGRYLDYETDDLIVYVKNPTNDNESKLLCQIKHRISITNSNKEFADVLQAAWNDFNNPKIFVEGKDAIALITGPLSEIDTIYVRDLLKQTKYAEDALDFRNRIYLGNFTSNQQREKLKVFKKLLKKANNNTDLTPEQLWKFLRSFHLLIYDLDIKGVILSLLHSLIRQFSEKSATSIWDQLNVYVEWECENAGVITIESIPDDLKSAFVRRAIELIPPDLVRKLSYQGEVDWNQNKFASELAIANFLGSWNENYEDDKAIVEQLVKEDFSIWILKMRRILQEPDSPLSLKNGVWNITKRQELWKNLGPRLFDDDLINFKKQVVTVLTERDPQFDLSLEERFLAAVEGKMLKRSHRLRKGLAESLAILGSYPDALINCSLNKPEKIVVLAVREIFDNADWILWGSLTDLLPLLAEASPEEFLKAVEFALQKTPCPFDTLFVQEGDGFDGNNYISGVLWALETLAWDEEYLVRVSVILGDLASRDPGGRWANRPANSLSTILLPWLPQTKATFEKRKIAIQTLEAEFPEVAWKVLIRLLPNQHQESMGSRKPIWRETIPYDGTKKVTQQDYWNQVYFYTSIAVEMAKKDIFKLNELINHLDNLPQSFFETILEFLVSKEITSKSESERLLLWNTLVKFALLHKRYYDSKWALSSELVEKIDQVSEKIAPQNPLNLYYLLFGGNDFELYDENKDSEEQQRELETRKRRAVEDIITNMGFEKILEFAKVVQSPLDVGSSLGFVADNDVDDMVLPNFLDTESICLNQFATGFVRGRFSSRRWQWVDTINTSKWTPSQIGQFLSYLPFVHETWERSKQLLGEDESYYWAKTTANPYDTNSLELAIDMLIEYDRPYSAIKCLYRMQLHKKLIDNVRAVRALYAVLGSSEKIQVNSEREIVEIIKALQENESTNSDDLFKIEWAYLPFLINNHWNASPKLLERWLASKPEFFCEVIRLVFRSKNEKQTTEEPTEHEKRVATNAYRLLSKWRTPPGYLQDGSYNGNALSTWLEAVKNECTKTGHFEIAMSTLGQVLIHTPADPNGLWIHRSAAKELNEKDVEAMREGFSTGLYNSRGVHDFSKGKEEQELANKYKSQAEAVENEGFFRLATILRDLATFYEHEAKRESYADPFED